MAHKWEKQETSEVSCWHVRIRFQQYNLVGSKEMETAHFSSNSTAGHSEGRFPGRDCRALLPDIPLSLKSWCIMKMLWWSILLCVFSQETTFIEQVVEDEGQMEGTTPGCSKIMNWHVHLEARNFDYPRGWLLQKNLDAVLPIKWITAQHCNFDAFRGKIYCFVFLFYFWM